MLVIKELRLVAPHVEDKDAPGFVMSRTALDYTFFLAYYTAGFT